MMDTKPKKPDQHARKSAQSSGSQFATATIATRPTAAQLRKDLLLMRDYLLMCVRKDDWHGVMDASADIREIVAKLSMLN